MAAAARSQGLSPGFKFNPSDQMLVELFLLPYLIDGELPVRGLVFVEDDHLGGLPLPPWILLDRHGRGHEDEAYFVAPMGAGDGARQVRSVAGGSKWVKQRSEGKGEVVVAPGGEEFRWEKFSLNFHRDDRRSGSTGWVMHEYIVSPPAGSAVAASHRATHIAFTGHGQNRKRVPDGYVLVLDAAAAVAAPPPPPESEQSNQEEQEYAVYTDQIQQQCFVSEQQMSNQDYFPETAAEQSSQQFFVPAEEQSSHQLLPAEDQSSHQFFLPAEEQMTQSNQEYAYDEQSQCYILPEQQQLSNQEYAYSEETQCYIMPEQQQQSNQEAEYAFACYDEQQQQQQQSNQEAEYAFACYDEQQQQEQQSNQDAEYAFACYDEQQQQQQQYFHGDLTSWQEPLVTSSSSTSQQFLGQEKLMPDGLLLDGGFGEISQQQGNQEYAYCEESQCYIMPEQQQQSNQEAEFAFACYDEQQQQQHYFHEDLTSWQEPLETTTSQ
uniref:NAC domain-containing protein n=1 Tax=Oryza meridionalis TaxID=40149 RepID=A0A0E0CJA8_9ORYZ